MWTAVYMSKDEASVLLLKRVLRENGIIAMIRHREEYYEILVPSMEVSSAHNIIIDTEI